MTCSGPPEVVVQLTSPSMFQPVVPMVPVRATKSAPPTGRKSLSVCSLAEPRAKLVSSGGGEPGAVDGPGENGADADSHGGLTRGDRRCEDKMLRRAYSSTGQTDQFGKARDS